MRKKFKIRNLVYVSQNKDENCFYSYGIEFSEFMGCLSKLPEGLILLKHDQFNDSKWNNHTRFEYITKDQFSELMKENVYHYGDFCWVDFKDESSLEQLEKYEIAELLYFSHTSEPLKQVFIPKIKNRFAYFSHDDGWFNKLFIYNTEEYGDMLSNVLIYKLHVLTRRKFNPIPTDIVNILLEHTEHGLFIDLDKIIKDRSVIRIPVATVGHFTDMDKVYELRGEIENYKFCLEYSKSTWRSIGNSK